MRKETDIKPVLDYRRSLKQTRKGAINRFIKVECYINRPLAHLLVRAIYKTGITPNQLTFFSFFLALTASFLFSRGQYRFFILAGILTQLSAIVDCADGQLARAKELCSQYGSHLDLFFDRVGDFFLITFIALGYYYYSGNLLFLHLGFLASALYLLQINLYYITNSFTGNKEKGETGEARALLLLLVFIASIANRLDILILLITGETILINIYRIFYFIFLGYRKDRKLP